ncbi:DUF192 domain-containing protein [Methanobrevibacter curvatus]|uniref:ACR n=1 Tax=Methanobrevibacter curvatus TaxID=49547 RepID=A0A166A5L1_9EURY|nr:DUF192 domain-containing protein [Methanobrevibacter curvatus]KZX11602.1 hypothetical protein MBCUR_13560 [Methanobrevibacter curvatus]
MKTLTNKTKNKTLGNVKCANSFLKRFKGLMFKSKIENGIVLKIPKSKYKNRSSIHMFFMKQPLDIIFLDKNKKVFEMTSLKPWQTYTPKKPARFIIELKKDTIKENNINLNDKIDFK